MTMIMKMIIIAIFLYWKKKTKNDEIKFKEIIIENNVKFKLKTIIILLQKKRKY